MSGLRRFVEEKIQLLEKAIDQCFSHIEQPLQEGVRNARTSYRRILGACLVVSDPFQGEAVIFSDICLISKLLLHSSTASEGNRELKESKRE